MRLFLAMLILLTGLFAGHPAEAKKRSEQERAREAVESGVVIPLRKIIRNLKQRGNGRLLDAQLEEVGPGRWIYNLKVLDRDGNVADVIVDGASGEILDWRGGGN
jgi:uncharacterized membrane protein YkoI